LPPFLAEAFLREERLLGAMVPKTGDYEFETNLRTAQPGGTKHKKNHSKRNHERVTIIWQTAMETIHQIHRDHPTINGNEGMPTVHNSKKYM
jgi:hypothetical protein